MRHRTCRSHAELISVMIFICLLTAQFFSSSYSEQPGSSQTESTSVAVHNSLDEEDITLKKLRDMLEDYTGKLLAGGIAPASFGFHPLGLQLLTCVAS